jgi:hypothetical protein
MQILKRDLDKPISFKEKMSNFVQNLRNNIQNIPLTL